VVVFQSAPGHRRAEYCNERVCLSVCPLACLSRERRVQPSPHFRCMLPAAVARSLAALRYVMYFRLCGCSFVIGRAKATQVGGILKVTHQWAASCRGRSLMSILLACLSIGMRAVTGRKRRADKLLMRLCPVGVAAPAWHADSDCQCCVSLSLVLPK